jgi:hypothetical protein
MEGQGNTEPPPRPDVHVDEPPAQLRSTDEFRRERRS